VRAWSAPRSLQKCSESNQDGAGGVNAVNQAGRLYNSNQAGSRDQFGSGNKFITPTVVNGKVYVGTTNSVGVFGLLP
jgi:hypothetical protein